MTKMGKGLKSSDQMCLERPSITGIYMATAERRVLLIVKASSEYKGVAAEAV